MENNIENEIERLVSFVMEIFRANFFNVSQIIETHTDCYLYPNETTFIVSLRYLRATKFNKLGIHNKLTIDGYFLW